MMMMITIIFGSIPIQESVAHKTRASACTTNSSRAWQHTGERGGKHGYYVPDRDSAVAKTNSASLSTRARAIPTQGRRGAAPSRQQQSKVHDTNYTIDTREDLLKFAQIHSPRSRDSRRINDSFRRSRSLQNAIRQRRTCAWVSERRRESVLRRIPREFRGPPCGDCPWRESISLSLSLPLLRFSFTSRCSHSRTTRHYHAQTPRRDNAVRGLGVKEFHRKSDIAHGPQAICRSAVGESLTECVA